MRLHILPDEKIINRTIETFEHVFPEENKYIILTNGQNCNYVDVSIKNVFVVKFGTDDFWERIGDYKDYSCIIVHYLSLDSARFVNKIEHPKIYWIEWGGDLYNNLLSRKGYKLYTNTLYIFRFIYGSLVKAFVLFLLRKRPANKEILSAIKKIKYFVPDSMYDEYPLLLKYYPEFEHLVYKEFYYYPIEQVVSITIRKKFCEGEHVIVGNSCSFSGNHLEVIERLSHFDINDNRKVIFPISYAGNVKYRDEILRIGKKKLGRSFTPIVEYVALQKFNEILLSASYFVYNNYRQEAVGNILTALYFGGKVFLSDNNPLLLFYQRLGLKIFSISEMNINSLNEPLDGESRNHNRSIILKNYSLDRLYTLVSNNF